MGSNLSLFYATATDKHGVIKCVPEHKYREMPPRIGKEPGQCVFEFKAMHKKCMFKPAPENSYWWCCVKFVPNDDSRIVVSSGAFYPRSNHAWALIKHIPNGRIIMVSIPPEDRLSGVLFNDSRMSNYPKLHIHPSGKYIGYVGLEGVKITTTQQKDIFCKLKDLRSCNYRCCSFSPNGKYLAIVLSANGSFELLISLADKGTAFDDSSVNLCKLFPNFKFTRMYNEHLECKWSPDSQYIAVCSNTFCLMVLDKNLNKVVDIVEDILPEDRFPSWSSTFDFNPCSRHDLMAVGTNQGQVYVVSIRSKNIVLETEPLTKEAIDCLKYGPLGSSIAISTRDMCIFLLDGCTGHITFSIDIRSQCPENGEIMASFPAVMSLDFSARGELLVSGSSDGMIRMWKLPWPQWSLFSLCIHTLLKCVPPCKVKELPLPELVRDKVFAFPSYK